MTVEITMGAERDYNGSVVLTTNSPASSYGLPVLRVSGRPGRRYDGIDDLGPASQMPGQIVEITCAEYVLSAVEPSCVKVFGGNDSDEAIEAARLFCSQWADGPQLYGVGVGENGERYLQTAWPAQGWADRRNGQIPYVSSGV